MLISIIIIVKYDRGINLTLKRLKTIEHPTKFEIIVVDASNGRLDDIKIKHPEAKWIYYQSESIKKITIPEQRNMGVKNARGDKIIFLDSNCEPQKNWLVELQKESLNEKIVAGSIEPKNKNSFNNLKPNYINYGYLNECPTANVLIDKSVFTTVGLFDENFSCGEDIDFMWRATRLGFKIKHNPNALVSHDWGSFYDEIKRSFRYGIAKVQLFKKHRYKIKQLFTNEAANLIYPIYILFFPVTIIFPYYPFFLLLPIIKNRHNSPFKSTSLNIIHGLGIIRGLAIQGKTINN